jgi:glutathione synthase
MKLAFFVNEVETEISEYTTTRLAVGACKRGHDVWYVGAGDVIYEPGGSLRAKAYRAKRKPDDDLATFLERAKDEGSCEEIALSDIDAVMLRNDSIEDLHARPWAASAGIVFGHMLADRGVWVGNDPDGLSRAASKLYLEEFPEELRPRSFVSRDPDEIKSFVKDTGRTVIKPLYGAKGRNVFLVDGEDDPNLSQMIEAVLADGYVLAQERVDGAEKGDIRMFLVDGEPLELEGQYAAFRRVPPPNDVRANISTGGKAEPIELGERELHIADLMRDRLRRDGMFFVGIDIIGDKVVEINAESAGGMQAVEHFSKMDYTPKIIQRLEEAVIRRRAA